MKRLTLDILLNSQQMVYRYELASLLSDFGLTEGCKPSVRLAEIQHALNELLAWEVIDGYGFEASERSTPTTLPSPRIWLTKDFLAEVVSRLPLF